MSTQKQTQQLINAQKRRGLPSGLKVTIAIFSIIIIALFIAIFVILYTQGINQGSITLTTIAGVAAVVISLIGLMIAFFQWRYPVSPDPPPDDFSDFESPPANKTAYRSILASPPLTDPRTIEQREETVKEVYAKLTRSNITAIVLTGIGGVGKSTLAALIYRYFEDQQHAGSKLFFATALWLRIDPAVTMADLVGTLCKALNKPMPDLSSLSPRSQAMALFNILKAVDKARLVILDQFENLLDGQGSVLPDRPGVGEWLDILNSKQCTCRILLTSRPRPQGTSPSPITYLQEYPVKDMQIAEGTNLLRKQGVTETQGTDAELRIAVERCSGHALSLTLLATILHDHNLNLATLFKNPTYEQFWTGDIASNLLDYIYTKQLNIAQRKLLLAFSVYREAVLLGAAEALIDFGAEIPRSHIQPALSTLLAQHLLQASGDGRYQLHAIVADFAQSHFVDGDAQANQKALQAAHTKAAQYYRQQAINSRSPHEQRRQIGDVHDLIDAIWQYRQGEKWQEVYDLMEQEDIFTYLKRWGNYAMLLDLYKLLLDKWHPEPLQEARIYNNLGEVYNALEQKETARNWYEKALSIRREKGV